VIPSALLVVEDLSPSRLVIVFRFDQLRADDHEVAVWAIVPQPHPLVSTELFQAGTRFMSTRNEASPFLTVPPMYWALLNGYLIS
jgi:hypothetical protein